MISRRDQCINMNAASIKVKCGLKPNTIRGLCGVPPISPYYTPSLSLMELCGWLASYSQCECEEEKQETTKRTLFVDQFPESRFIGQTQIMLHLSSRYNIIIASHVISLTTDGSLAAAEPIRCTRLRYAPFRNW